MPFIHTVMMTGNSSWQKVIVEPTGSAASVGGCGQNCTESGVGGLFNGLTDGILMGIGAMLVYELVKLAEYAGVGDWIMNKLQALGPSDTGSDDEQVVILPSDLAEELIVGVGNPKDLEGEPSADLADGLIGDLTERNDISGDSNQPKNATQGATGSGQSAADNSSSLDDQADGLTQDMAETVNAINDATRGVPKVLTFYDLGNADVDDPSELPIIRISFPMPAN